MPLPTLSVSLSGTVEQIISVLGVPSKVQINVAGGDDLYREIRVPNVFHDGNGGDFAVELGAEVEITITVRAPQSKREAA